MKSLVRCSLSLALAASPLLAAAQVAVGDPWVRATVPQQQASGAFMTLTSPKGLRLVEARSPVAGVVEVHEMSMAGGVMKMKPVEGGLELPAGKPVELKPGGYHVMLMALKKTLTAGETVPITLVFEGADKKRETVEVAAPIRPLNSMPASSGHSQHKH